MRRGGLSAREDLLPVSLEKNLLESSKVKRVIIKTKNILLMLI